MGQLAHKLAHLPKRPGVYLMKDHRGKVLYVGKASRLDHRVRSYFTGAPEHPKVAAMVAKVEDFETIVTDSDVEALLLEMTLIKEKRPAYNIRLRDDKRFPFLQITLTEDFPKAVVTRRTPADGSKYFGPYTDAGALRRTLKTLRTVFPIRSCMGTRPGRGPRYKECLDFHIKRCAAPCIDKVSQDDYRTLVDEMCSFLEGREEKVLDRLQIQMTEASRELQFEKAAVLRDRIQAVQRMMRRQKMLDTGERDMDVLAVARDEGTAYGTVLEVRGGKVLGKEKRKLTGTQGESDADVMSAFIAQYYMSSETIPGEVATRTAPSHPDLLADWLSRKGGRKVRVSTPQRGRLAGLARLSEENSRLDLEEARGQSTEGGVEPSVYALQKVLGLNVPPMHILGFDISNIQGAQPVASIVVFQNGKAARSSYRRLKIRTVQGANDFAMMAEAVGRRAARIVSGEFAEPDLFLIDGGLGQVGAAATALEQEGLGHIPVIGLAKRFEEIHRPGREPLRLPHSHPGLRLLIQVRNESHRVAVTYHRTRRKKETLGSELDGIKGIGHHRKVLLLKAFGSLDAVRKATPQDLASVPGIGPRVAEQIVAGLSEKGGAHGPH